MTTYGDYVTDKKFMRVPQYRGGLRPLPWPDITEYDVSQDFARNRMLAMSGRDRINWLNHHYPESRCMPGLDNNLGMILGGLGVGLGIGVGAGGYYLYGRIKNWWDGSGSTEERNEIENEIVAGHLRYTETGGKEGLTREEAEALLELLNTGKFNSWIPWAIGGAVALVALIFAFKK